jgi:hypothetical protein
VTKNGVTDVIVVRRLRAVKKQRVFQFGRIADDAVVADDDILAQVGVVANPAVLADDGRAFDHHAVFNDRAFANENFFTDERAAFAFVAKFRFQVRGNVVLNFFERVPCEFAAIEDGGVFSLRQVKQIGWFEHIFGSIFMTLLEDFFKDNDQIDPFQGNIDAGPLTEADL